MVLTLEEGLDLTLDVNIRKVVGGCTVVMSARYTVTGRPFAGCLLYTSNPQGTRVTSFKAPTAEELAHDFLWRVHRAVPLAGQIGVFNRSQYEDVLVARVRKLVPKDVWKKRYDCLLYTSRCV